MEVELTEDQKAFVQQGVESGRYRSAEDAVRNALALWEERERRRMEILFAVELAEAEIARGEGRVISSEEESAQLAEEIKQRGLRRLAAESGKL
jgi:putative addiction module CopG family antidote